MRPRIVTCPVTGFSWLARTESEAWLRWAWPAIMAGVFIVGVLAGVVWERIG